MASLYNLMVSPSNSLTSKAATMLESTSAATKASDVAEQLGTLNVAATIPERPTTVVEEIDVSAWEGPGKFACVLHGLFTPQECEELVARSEAEGYGKASVNMGGGREVMMEDYRKSARCIIDDPAFAEELWQRIKTVVEADGRYAEALLRRSTRASTRKGTQSLAVGLNERLRFLRYDEGDYFAPHMDGAFVRQNEAGSARRGEHSLVTCQLYLNDGFEGGATRFLDLGNESTGVDVVPRAGSVLLFQHRLGHEGSLLVHGRKYAIRTDVMYTDQGEGREYAREPV